ncbi:universal stress protein [Pacificitalea manganoxidans]|uniref:Universal stress protein n=1 Tax=Pacificitalea manganoxidans TaxID=1411902 RepID=A0A291LVU1_9RHOB|nr:universal stress protein [Pacificitalea manganoxidans]MAQ46426.1 universal stress protein [Actibacterium sp.]OWU70845.1 universal stress protein [Roseovarius sp. 22II1-1F6A]ATI40856.1 universal stress protein [Pacificitalea manganoxidans]MBF53721.1 universal stress protein [Actibacterium sp.]MDR6308185.1 nucleotide-binding universal stress UspA family protein [Pacificitalea manganoxidans]|tara:strand:- start:1105 stop:1539 length:435 start_codon:yes stop_codon:yes gene_type:complete
MTSEVFVVAYESDDDAGLLAYAIDRATKDGATLKIVHILEWSPYKFLTPQEIEERHTRRKQEMLRAQEIIIDPAVEKARKAGIEATGELRYGTVVEQIADIAARSSAAMIFVGRSGSNSISARVFGSVPLGLAQIAPVPTVIVP